MHSSGSIRLIRPALAAAFLAVSLFAVTQVEATAQDLSGVTITVGQQGSDTQFGFIASKLFDSAPYKIKYATFSSPGNTLTALATGNVDIANNVSQWTATQAAAAATVPWTAATAPYKNILVSAPGNPAQFDRFVIASSKASGITDLKQAKGKRWGIIPGSSLNLMAIVALNKLGWTMNDITVVNLDATNQVLALQTGQVDILFNVTDNLPAALQQGAKIIGTANDYGLTVYTGFLANTAAINDPLKGKAIEDFVRRMVEYENWYAMHPKELQAALVEGQHLTPAQAETVWKFARIIPKAPGEIAAYSQQLADQAQAAGLIKQHVDAAALLDNRYGKVINDTIAKTNLLSNLKASY